MWNVNKKFLIFQVQNTRGSSLRGREREKKGVRGRARGREGGRAIVREGEREREGGARRGREWRGTEEGRR